MTGIEVKNISKAFNGLKVLDKISFNVEKGALVSLLGPSGCGKTTTLKIIAGLLCPDSGDICFQGRSVLDVPVEKRGAVIVFQDHLLFPHMTVAENIAFGLKMSGLKKKSREQKIKEMLDLVQLNGHETKYPVELSGGQKQRVAIARALAIEPQVLLLDEPFSNLDASLSEAMRTFVFRLQKELNITTVLVTHNQEDALMSSDKIAVMLEGEIKQFGTPAEVYHRPATPEIASFFGEKNYIAGTIKDGLFQCIFGTFPVEFNRFLKVKAMLRPEDINIAKIVKAENKKILTGKICYRKYAGNRIYYTVLLAGIKIKCMTDSESFYGEGEQVGVEFNFERAIFYELVSNSVTQ